MTTRFYLISSHDGTPAALVEAPSQRSALLFYSMWFHHVKPANARDVASAFQKQLLIIPAPVGDALPDEKNEQT